MKLADIAIASPCPQSWEQMRGDDACRFCQLCEKHVYNFSSMTSREILDLIQEKEGHVCGRLYRRRDGTILTADCPVGRRHARYRLRRFAGRCAAAVLLGACFLVGGVSLSRAPGQLRARALVAWFQSGVAAIHRWMGGDDEPTPVLRTGTGSYIAGRISCSPAPPPPPFNGNGTGATGAGGATPSRGEAAQ